MQAQNISPTLAAAAIELKNLHIEKACKIFRNTVEGLSIRARLENGERVQFYFDHLPNELYQAFHDYATRLIGERLQLEHAPSH